MCFLKSICNKDLLEVNPKTCEVPVQEIQLQSEKNKHSTQFYCPYFYFIPHLVLVKNQQQIEERIKEIFEGIKRNSQQVKRVTQKLQSCDEQMNKLWQNMESLSGHNPVDKLEQKKTSSCILDSPSSQLTLESYKSPNNLTNLLFGPREYKYKLALVEDFPEIIYRERNIKLMVKLIACNGKILKNDNVINLYLSMCDSNGKWVNNNRVGDPMLKGRTSTQLSSGECQFNKVYPQDISRTFTDGQLNFVVYAKSLAVVYDQIQLCDRQKVFVEPDLIQPLILQNITIKAKKRCE